jgi:hypothetical protein
MAVSARDSIKRGLIGHLLVMTTNLYPLFSQGTDKRDSNGTKQYVTLKYPATNRTSERIADLLY